MREHLTQLENVACKCGKTVGRQLSTVLNTSNKKNAMFLLAVVFMVSLNFGPIGYVPYCILLSILQLIYMHLYERIDRDLVH